MSTAGEHSVSPATFKFSNIGPVNNATLTLGGLTVIAGRNNTGKTYIAYSLYGFLKDWTGWPYVRTFLSSAANALPQLATIHEGICNTGRAEVPVALPVLAKNRRLLAKRVAGDFSPQFRHVFNSRRDSFQNAALDIELDDTSSGHIPSPTSVKFGRRTIKMQYENGNIKAYIEGADQSGDPENLRTTAYAYFIFLMQDIFPTPFILSAERFGISLFYRELDFTKNQIVDLLQKYESGQRGKTPSPFLIVDRTTSRYAVPIKDNIDFTRSIPDLPRDPSPIAEHKLFDDIKNMVDGYYSNAKDDIRFISKARKSGRFNIPLHLASSSARGLSDLYFFLRYAASRGQLLIIDEPESHLDTANQVQFARLLARFVGAGLRVMITTHSDYIVKELNNLIMLSRIISENKKIVRKLKYRIGDELKPDNVRAYVAEDGGLTPCSIGPYGIEAPVFDNTINDINKVAIELSSRVDQRVGV